MTFGYACRFGSRPRGETPAPPPEKRTSALPLLPACRVLSGQIGKCIFCLLGAFRIWFGYLEHPQTSLPLNNHPALKSGMAAPEQTWPPGQHSMEWAPYQTPQALTVPLRRSIGAMRRHYRFSCRVKGLLPSPTAAICLMPAW